MAGYCSGPVFWSFAENAVAIIGACLPPLAAFKTRKQSFPDKRNLSLSNFQSRSGSNHYATLDDGFRLDSSLKDAPIDPRDKQGPITHIHAVALPFADRSQPQNGIRVNTSLSTEWSPSERIHSES